jgi:hypothetical protein
VDALEYPVEIFCDPAVMEAPHDLDLIHGAHPRSIPLRR